MINIKIEIHLFFRWMLTSNFTDGNLTLNCSLFLFDLPLQINEMVDSDDNLSHAWFWLYNKKKMSSKD